MKIASFNLPLSPIYLSLLNNSVITSFFKVIYVETQTFIAEL